MKWTICVLLFTIFGWSGYGPSRTLDEEISKELKNSSEVFIKNEIKKLAYINSVVENPNAQNLCQRMADFAVNFQPGTEDETNESGLDDFKREFENLDNNERLLFLLHPKTKLADEPLADQIGKINEWVLFWRYIYPFHFTEIESLSLGDEQAGKTVLTYFFQKMLREGVAARWALDQKVLQATVFAQMSNATASWLGVLEEKQALTLELARWETVEGQDGQDRNIHKAGDIKQDPLIEKVNRLNPILVKVEDTLVSRYQKIFPELWHQPSLGGVIQVLGERAKDALRIYQETKNEGRVLGHHLFANEQVESGLWATALSAEKLNRRPYTGFQAVSPCELGTLMGKPAVFRNNAVQFSWREAHWATLTEKVAANGEIRDVDLGVFARNAKVVVSEESEARNLVRLDLSEPFPLEVVDQQLTAALRQFGLHPHLAISHSNARLLSWGDEIQIEIAFDSYIPTLSPGVYHSARFTLGGASSSLEKAVETLNKTLTRAILEKMDWNLAQGIPYVFAKETGLSLHPFRQIVGVKPISENGSRFEITCLANLEGYWVPKTQSFRFEGRNLYLLGTELNAEFLKYAVVSAPKGGNVKKHNERVRKHSRIPFEFHRLIDGFAAELALGMDDQWNRVTGTAFPAELDEVVDVLREVLNLSFDSNVKEWFFPGEAWNTWLTNASLPSGPGFEGLALIPYVEYTASDIAERLLQTQLVTSQREAEAILEQMEPFFLNGQMSFEVFTALRQVFQRFPNNPLFPEALQQICSEDGNPYEDSAVFLLQRLEEFWTGWEKWRERFLDLIKEKRKLKNELENQMWGVNYQDVIVNKFGTYIHQGGRIDTGVFLSLGPFVKAIGDSEELLQRGMGYRGKVSVDKYDSIHEVLKKSKNFSTFLEKLADEKTLLNGELFQEWSAIFDRSGGFSLNLETWLSLCPAWDVEVLKNGFGLTLQIPGMDVPASPWFFDWDNLRNADFDKSLAKKLPSSKSEQTVLLLPYFESLRALAEHKKSQLNGQNRVMLVLQALEALRKLKPGGNLEPRLKDALPKDIEFLGKSWPVFYEWIGETLTIQADISTENNLGKAFRVVEGIVLDLEGKDGPVLTIDWQRLTTSPSVSSMTHDLFKTELPFLDSSAQLTPSGNIALTVQWQPPGLPRPLTLVWTFAPQDFWHQDLFDVVLEKLMEGIKFAVENRSFFPEEKMKFGEPTPLEPGSNGWSFPGTLNFGDVSLQVVLDIRPREGLSLKVVDAKVSLVDHPLLKGLNLNALVVAEKEFDLKGRLALRLRADVNVSLPGTAISMQVHFILDSEGLRIAKESRLDQKGWLDFEEEGFSVGNFSLRYLPEIQRFEFAGQISLPKGEERSKKLRLDVKGMADLVEKRLVLSGKFLFFSSNMANISAVYTQQDETIRVKFDTEIGWDLIEIKGKAVIRNGNPGVEGNATNPDIHAKLQGEVLGVPLIEAEGHFRRDRSGYIETGILFSPVEVQRNSIYLNFGEDFSNKVLGFKAEKGVEGLKISLAIEVDENDVRVIAAAEIAKMRVSITFHFPSLTNFSLDEIVRALKALDPKNLNLPGSGDIHVLDAGGIEGSGKKGGKGPDGSGGGVSEKPDTPPDKTGGPEGWNWGWKMEAKKYKKRSFFGLISESKTRWEPEYRDKTSSKIFPALGLGKERTKKLNGFYKDQAPFGLAITNNARLYITLMSNGSWVKADWETSFGSRYGRGTPGDDDLYVLVQRNSRGVDLAVFQYKERFYAVLNGGPIGTAGEKSVDITDLVNGLGKDLDPQLRRELSWYIGFYALKKETLTMKRVKDVVFLFLEDSGLCFVKPPAGELTIIPFTLLAGNQTVANFPVDTDLQYLQNLKTVPFKNPSTQHPINALLIVGSNHGLLLEEFSAGLTGTAYSLSRGRSKGAWHWLNRSSDAPLVGELKTFSQAQQSVFGQLFEVLAEGNLQPGKGDAKQWDVYFSNTPSKDLVAFKVAFKTAEAQPTLAFGDASRVFDGAVLFKQSTWQDIKKELDHNWTYLPENREVTPEFYIESLLANDWKALRWNADPTGYLGFQERKDP